MYLHAAVEAEAVLAVKERYRPHALFTQGGIAVYAAAAEEVVGVGDKARHGEGVPLVDDVAQVGEDSLGVLPSSV